MLHSTAAFLQHDLMAAGILETWTRAVATAEFRRFRRVVDPSHVCSIRDGEVEARCIAREKQSEVEESRPDIRAVRRQRKSAVSRDIDGDLEVVWEVKVRIGASHNMRMVYSLGVLLSKT
jgi:hypothetical protein